MVDLNANVAVEGQGMDKTGERRAGIVRDCVVTAPGLHDNPPDPGYAMPEITCLTVGGADNDHLGLGGAIVGNRVSDIPYNRTESGLPSSYQPSVPHAITVSNCKGVEIAENQIVNCDGVGVYIVSWTDEDIAIRDNRLIGVNVGIQIGIALAEVATLAPQHVRTRIGGNVILLGKNVHIPTGVAPAGLKLAVDNGVPTDTIRLKGTQFRHNLVRGSNLTDNGTNYFPAGVDMQLNTVCFEDLCVENNTLELPDPETGDTGLNEPYENALRFKPRYRYTDPNLGVPRRIRVHGNRNVVGQDLRLKLAQDASGGLLADKRWAVYSNRLARFRSPSYDGRAGAFYDEFVGQLPRSALGWQAVTGGAGSVSAATGEVDRPGIAKLSTGAAGLGSVLLRSGADAVILGGGLGHAIEFAMKRNQTASPADDYECRIGLLNAADNQGAYFVISHASGYLNMFRAVCVDASGSVLVNNSPTESGEPPWRRLGIRVSPDAGAIEFWFDGAYWGKATTHIPTGALCCALKVVRLSNGSGQERYALLDYFQHQVG